MTGFTQEQKIAAIKACAKSLKPPRSKDLAYALSDEELAGFAGLGRFMPTRKGAELAGLKNVDTLD